MLRPSRHAPDLRTRRLSFLRGMLDRSYFACPVNLGGIVCDTFDDDCLGENLCTQCPDTRDCQIGTNEICVATTQSPTQSTMQSPMQNPMQTTMRGVRMAAASLASCRSLSPLRLKAANPSPGRPSFPAASVACLQWACRPAPRSLRLHPPLPVRFGRGGSGLVPPPRAWRCPLVSCLHRPARECY